MKKIKKLMRKNLFDYNLFKFFLLKKYKINFVYKIYMKIYSIKKLKNKNNMRIFNKISFVIIKF